MNLAFKSLSITLILIVCFSVKAFSFSDSTRVLEIVRSDAPVRVDGILDEQVWSNADKALDFWLQAPVDDRKTERKTEVMASYDDRFIYFAAICYDDDDYVIQSLKRDQWGNNDDFAILLDPVGQQATGYGFGVNAMGAQTEVLLRSSDGANDDIADQSWDNKWFSAVKREADRWIVEMAIPFKTVRFADGRDQWNVNFIRVDPGKNENHVWSPVPRQFEMVDMAYFGILQWDQAPKKSGGNISLIPYVSARLDQTPDETSDDFAIGGDAKISLSPTLNLDLTFNPDFSQVEVDRQVTNLTRFNIFFPERRQFFLENADVFNAFGQFADRPFYSRRIGLNNLGQTVPILYGARVSGNLTKKLRVGLMNMHSRGSEAQAGQNYSSVSFQQRLGKRSAVKGLFVNRQGFDQSDVIENDFGRNVGGEITLSNKDGKIQGNIGLINSIKPGIAGQNNMSYGLVQYNGQNFRGFLALKHVPRNYYVDMGFNSRIENFNPTTGTLERIPYTQMSSMLNYYIYPEDSKKVNFHWSGLENFAYFNNDGSVNEWYTRLRHFIFFKNTSQLRFRLNNNYVDLIFPFALTTPSLPSGSYNMTEFNVQFNTDRRKKLTTEWFIVYGQFFNGNKLTVDASLSYRIQPWGRFAIGLERNDLWFPDPYEDVTLTLATAEAEINFATNLFWTTFLQYNTQNSTFNINSRLQWRYAPMSDIFLVYTDNYDVAGMFGAKSRSIVLKANYWLTL